MTALTDAFTAINDLVGSTGSLAVPRTPIALDDVAAVDKIPFGPDEADKVRARHERMLLTLTTAELNGPEFSRRRDALAALGEDSFAAGRDAVADLLGDDRLGQPEEAAVDEQVRELADALRGMAPPPAADLLVPHRVLKLIPWGNHLQVYCRSFQAGIEPVHERLVLLETATQALSRRSDRLQAIRAELWSELVALRRALQLGDGLDPAIVAQVMRLESSDPYRARALHREVLVPLRRQRQRIRPHLGATVNVYVALGALKRALQEHVRGSRQLVAATVELLAEAQSLGRAAGQDIDLLRRIAPRIPGAARDLPPLQPLTPQSAAAAIDRLMQRFQEVAAAADAIDLFRHAALGPLTRARRLAQTQAQRIAAPAAADEALALEAPGTGAR